MLKMKDMNMKNLMQVPQPTSCCLCLPIRGSLLAWGYIKLNVLFLAGIGLFTAIGLHFLFDRWPGLDELSGMALLASYFAMELVFTNVLLIGTHAKNPKVLGVFARYTWVHLVMLLAIKIYIYFVLLPLAGVQPFEKMEIVLIVSLYSVLNYHILLLVKTEIRRLRDIQTPNLEFENKVVFHITDDTNKMVY